jgi:hypothetical protein
MKTDAVIKADVHPCLLTAKPGSRYRSTHCPIINRKNIFLMYWSYLSVSVPCTWPLLWWTLLFRHSELYMYGLPGTWLCLYLYCQSRLKIPGHVQQRCDPIVQTSQRVTLLFTIVSSVIHFPVPTSHFNLPPVHRGEFLEVEAINTPDLVSHTALSRSVLQRFGPERHRGGRTPLFR